MPSILAKDRTVAAPGFNRWLVPPAALAIHLVNYIREFQIGRGVPPAQAYTVTMYVLASLLVAGFFANLAVRPVDASLFTLAPAARSQPVGFGQEPLTAAEPARSSNWPLVAAAWLVVALPLSWGVFNTISLALQMVQ